MFFRPPEFPKIQIIDSSCIRTVAYDDQRPALYIRFNSSAIYRYDEVPEHEYDNRIQAPSKGRYFLTRIRGKFIHAKMRDRVQKK